MKPDFVGAKMDLARTYYKLDEMREAKQEFHSIFQYKPSSRLQEIINLYLTNIKLKQHRKAPKGKTSVSFDLGFGYDSNANGAPDIDTFEGIILDEDSQEKPSAYMNTAVKVSYFSPIGKNQIISLNAGANRKENVNANFVNNAGVTAGGAYIEKTVDGQLMLSSQVFQAYVVGKYSGRNLAGIVMYTLPNKTGQKLGLMANVSSFRANNASSVRDANQYVFGLNFSSSIKKSALPDLVMSFSSGKSVTVESSSPYGKDFFAARYMLSKMTKIKYKVLFKASVNFGLSRYDGLFSGLERRETSTGLDLSADIFRHKNLKLILGARHSVNRSTMDIYTNKKNEFKTVFQWSFR